MWQILKLTCKSDFCNRCLGNCILYFCGLWSIYRLIDIYENRRSYESTRIDKMYEWKNKRGVIIKKNKFFTPFPIWKKDVRGEYGYGYWSVNNPNDLFCCCLSFADMRVGKSKTGQLCCLIWYCRSFIGWSFLCFQYRGSSVIFLFWWWLCRYHLRLMCMPASMIETHLLLCRYPY